MKNIKTEEPILWSSSRDFCKDLRSVHLFPATVNGVKMDIIGFDAVAFSYKDSHGFVVSKPPDEGKPQEHLCQVVFNS